MSRYTRECAALHRVLRSQESLPLNILELARGLLSFVLDVKAPRSKSQITSAPALPSTALAAETTPECGPKNLYTKDHFVATFALADIKEALPRCLRGQWLAGKPKSEIEGWTFYAALRREEP
jgi:hypothetical protein